MANAEPAFDAAGALLARVIGCLRDNPEKGVPGWDHLGGHERALLADYLAELVIGLKGSLRLVDYELASFDTLWAAEVGRTVQRRKAFGLQLPRPSKSAESRLNMLHGSTGVIVSHISTCFDQAAGIIAIIAALNRYVIRSDWGMLPTADQIAAGQADALLGGQSEAGRSAQVQVLSRAEEAVASAGPVNWLVWTMALRNSLRHRGAKMPVKLSLPPGESSDWKVLLLLPREPGRTDGLEMIRNREDAAISSLQESAEVTLRGVRNATQACLEVLLGELRQLWDRRLQQPELLSQPATQWKDQALITPTFAGFEPQQPFRFTHALTYDRVGVRQRALGLFDV